MKKKSILLCIGNENIGIKVKKLLIKKFKVTTIYSKKIKKNKSIIVSNKKKFNSFMTKTNKIYDFIILIYWPWLIKKNNFDNFKNSINFHPSFLPYGRGWYPYIHAHFKKFTKGITLHKINDQADTGDIWCQKKIILRDFLRADQIYKILEEEFFELFKRNFMKIINNKIKPRKQKQKLKFLKKKSIEKYNKLSLKKKYNLHDLLNHILIRTNNNKSYIFFNYKGKKKFLNIKLND